MSLKSPSWVKVDNIDKTLSFYWIRQHARDPQEFQVKVSNALSPFDQWTLIGECCEELTDSELASISSVHHYSRFIQVLAHIYRTIENEDRAMPIIIEGYAYNARQQSSARVLYELGGCLRLFLALQGFSPLVEIAPTSSKLHFAGNGKAKKKAMFEAWLGVWKLPDLRFIMNVVKHDSIKPRVPKNVPKPIEDMVDALAAAVAFCNR